MNKYNAICLAAFNKLFPKAICQIALYQIKDNTIISLFLYIVYLNK